MSMLENQFISETEDRTKKCNLFSFSDQFICSSSSSSPIQITVTLLFFLSCTFRIFCVCVYVCARISFISSILIHIWLFLFFSPSSSSSSFLFPEENLCSHKTILKHTHVHHQEDFFYSYYLFDVVRISSLNTAEYQMIRANFLGFVQKICFTTMKCIRDRYWFTVFVMVISIKVECLEEEYWFFSSSLAYNRIWHWMHDDCKLCQSSFVNSWLIFHVTQEEFNSISFLYILFFSYFSLHCIDCLFLFEHVQTFFSSMISTVSWSDENIFNTMKTINRTLCYALRSHPR